MGLIEQMAEHIGHRVTLLGGEEALDGLMCEDCGEYLIEWDDFEPAPDPGAVEALERLLDVVVPDEADENEHGRAAIRAARAIVNHARGQYEASPAHPSSQLGPGTEPNKETR